MNYISIGSLATKGEKHVGYYTIYRILCIVKNNAVNKKK